MNDGLAKDRTGAAKNAPDQADEPAGSRGALLSAHARTLDSRLRVAARSDRQATRRAAAHVVQLARRIAHLLPRVPTLLPVLPDGGRDARVRHYVLQAQAVPGTAGTRILTISTHSVLRYGEFEGTGKPVLWNEYDPLQPVVGWDLEIVLERLAEVLGQITDQVEKLEARVVERAKTLHSLLNSSPLSNRPLAIGAAPKPKAPSPSINETPVAAQQPTSPTASSPTAATPAAATPTIPAAPAVPATPPPARPTSVLSPPIVPPAKTITYGPAPTVAPPRTPAPNDDLLNVAADQAFAEQLAETSIEATTKSRAEAPTEFDDSMPELALIDLAFGAIPADYEAPIVSDAEGESVEEIKLFPMLSVAEPATAPSPPTETSTTDATAEREKRERRLFQHLRGR